MELNRPIIFFDTETTGTDVEKDRIIEIALIKIFPDGKKDELTMRFNPGIPIPPGATAVHGISDSDVVDSATFKMRSALIMSFIYGCDLAGFNSNSFDLPLLNAELIRAGVEWDYTKHKFIDVGNIYKILRPRTLSAAHVEFLGEELKDAHGAYSDAEAVMHIFHEMIHNEKIPLNIDELQSYSNFDKPILDLSGKFTTDADGDIIFNFGTHKDKKAKEQKGYLNWMIKANFAPDTIKIVNQVLASL